MTRQLKTIKLKGKDYVQVNTRVEAFNQEYKKGKIENEVNFNEHGVYFKSKVTPDVELPERFFTGHSFGTVKGEKALEKLETVAVGRALAFMGIGIVESIASADELVKSNSVSSQVPSSNTLEFPPVCTACGQKGIKTKAGFWTCPDWKKHKDDLRQFKMVQPSRQIPPNEQAFLKGM